MTVAAQDTSLADTQQIAPLSLQRVEHQRTEPNVRSLWYPDAFVVGDGGGNDLRRRERMCGLRHFVQTAR